MSSVVEKIAVLANAVDEWRRHYRSYSSLANSDVDEVRREAFERRRVVIGCMAASLLLHDRAVIELETKRAKIRRDFAAHGMIMPGHSLTFIGERPIAIEVDKGL